MGLFDKAKEAFQNLFNNDDNRSALKDQQAVRKTVETGKKQTTANLTSAPKSSVAVTTAPKERGINTNKAQPKAFSGTATTPSQNRLENYKRSFASPGSDDTFSTMKPVKTKFKAESLNDLEKTSDGIKWENINSRFLDKTVENTIKAANAKTEKVSRPVSAGLKGQGLMNTDSGGTRTPALNDDVQSAMSRFSDTLNRKTVTERDAKTVQVGKDGKAPRGLLPGDKVVTAPGTYTITAVNPDGTYQTDSSKTKEKHGQTWNVPKNTWTTAKSFEKEGGTYDDASAPRTFTTKQADPFIRLGNAVKASFTDDSRAREYHENQSRILADAEKKFISDGKSGDYTKNRGLMVRVGGIGMESEYTADEGLLSSATPMQKQIYNYMYNKHGKKSADEYFEALKSEVLNKQNAERTEKYIQKEVEENPVLSSVASVGANAALPQMNFVKNTIQGVKNTLNIGEYKPVDGNDSLDLISRYGSEVRGAISGQLENPLLRIGYNGVMSIADMGAQSLLYGTAGRIVTSGEKAAKFVTLAMSTVSANEAILDTIERGGSQKQAFTNGIVNGALEYLSESPAVEGVFEIFGGVRATKDIKGAVLQIARQMGVEAGGEAFANVSQTLADQILMGDKSSYSLYVKQLESMGMSEEEAKKQATKDMYIAQTLEAALTGAFAGGVMGGGATVMGKTFEGNAILNPETGYAQDLADTALSLEDFDEKHAETAEKIKNGEKVGIIEAANLKGAIAIHHSEWVKSNSEYIYAYVDMDAPNRLARALGQYTGRDDSGFRNRAFTQKWIEKSAEVFQQIETYSLTNNEKIRDDIERYLKISDALMYSNSLSDEAQATAVVRAMANGVINGNETSAAGDTPVGQEESIYEEIPQAEQEVSQVEELPVFEETQSSEEPKIEEMPVSEESQVEEMQEEPQTAPRTIADYIVGKRQGSSITYHKSAETVNASDTLERAKGNTEVAQLDYDLVKEGSDGVTFTKTDDFDGKTEPKVTGRWIYKEDTDSLYKMMVPDGEIIVDKSEYVPSGYTGFDVQTQKERESKWKAKKGYDAIQLNNEDYFYSFFADVLEDEPAVEDVQTEEALTAKTETEEIQTEEIIEEKQIKETTAQAEESTVQIEETATSEIEQQEAKVVEKPVPQYEYNEGDLVKIHGKVYEIDGITVDEVVYADAVDFNAEFIRTGIEEFNVLLSEDSANDHLLKGNVSEAEETAKVSQEVSKVSQEVSEEPMEAEIENTQDEKKSPNEEVVPFESGIKYEFEGNTFELREWEKGNQHRIYINPEGKRSNWGSVNLKTREYVETRGQKGHFEDSDNVLNTILSMWDKAQSEQKSDIIEEESTATGGENIIDEVLEETDTVVQNEEKNAETGVEQTQESEEGNVQRTDNELSEGASAGVLPEDEGDRGTGRTDSGDGYDSVSGLEQTSESDGGTVASDGGIEESSGQGFGSQDDLASGGRSDTGTAEGNDSGQFTGGRFYLNPENDANNMGVKARLNANFKAIEILKAVRDADHVVNEEDKKVLAQYSGWGGLPVAQHTERLSEFLTEKEVNEIVRSSMTAYYTPGYVIKFAYDIAKRLGISKNAKILEQACGSGRFFGLMPKGLRESSSVTGVELDTVSGEIAKLIYSDIDVRVQNYNTFSEEGYNLIVGNVPFSNSTVYDNNYRKESQYSLHNYFILKGLKQLSPGGIMIVLTSSSTLDSAKGFIKDKKGKSVAGARLAMSQEANLIGAVRLPAKTFGQTDVVTDMLIFQKKGEGVNDKLAQNFLELEDFEFYRGTIPVNEYFAQGYHDDMIVGYTDIGKDQFGKPKLVVSRKYNSNNEDLSEYLEKLPKNIYSKKIRENAERLAKEAEKKERRAVDADEKRSDGVMRVEKDGIYIYRNGKWFPYNPVKVVDGKTVEDTETIERIKGMYELLEEKKNLLELEKTSEDEKAVEKAIKRFSDMYDTFVKKYGYINDKKNRDAYGSEPNFGMLETLETVEKEGRNTKISKTDIFSKRVMKPYKPIESVDDVNDAMSASLAMHHDLDFDYMSELYGKSADEIVDELGDKVCYDPVEERYVLAEEYLSGNVREKLEKAEAVLENSPDNELAAKSVEALRQIQPPELDEAQIKPELGAAWINEQYITDFANYICGVKNSSFVKPAVMYNRATSEWSVNSNGWTSIKKWSTSAIDGLELLEKILNRKAIQVKDKEGRILEKPTVEAKAKAEELKNEFSSWIFSNKDRKNALLNTYNRLFNNYVERQVAVEHIKSFPGQSSAVTLREHQIRAALKAVYQKSTLLVHSVGAGKTYAMIAGAQEMKRLGIANKPLMVVPNAKVTEFRDDYIKLYPNANILVIGDEDFTTKSMSKTLAMIEQGDYDCIIMRMSSFDRFPVSPQLIEEYKEKELERYRSVLSVLTDTKNTKEKKKVERAIESYEKKIDEMIAKTSEEAFDIEVFFDRCGIDALLVDEAHNYKNLFFPTRLDVAGISSKGITLKTTKLHIITELLHKRGNHVVFSTATPTTNSLAEFYTMMRYLQPDKLAEMGIESFDQWASVFGEIETKSELNITGQKYRTKTRFAKLKNIADLVRVLRQSFDFVNSEDLTLPIPAAKIRHIKVPSPSLLYHTNILIDKDSVFHFTDSSGKPIKATLANYTLAKMASLDMRLARKVLIDEGVISPAVTEDMLDFEDSKINTCVKNVFKTYEDTKKNKGTQIIFLDKGVPKKAGGDAEESDKRYDFDLYNDIKKKLVAKGMKESEIASIHDYEKDVQKAQLSKKMDSGEIRVLIGSTQKAGTGINVQKRIAAMHHLDAPQRPADLIQRNGRGVRQGNLNDVVDVIYYSTLNSYDAPMWEMLERKSKGIEAVMKGDPNIREVDDSTLDDTFGNLSVAAANNPLLMELQDITEELQMLEAEKRNYQSAVLSNQWVLENYDSQKKTYEDRLDRATETKLKFDSTEAGHIKIGKETFEKPRDAGKALHDFVMSDKGNTVVSYRGLLVEAEKSAGDKDSFEVRITGAPWYNGRIHVSRVNKEGVKVKESNFFIAPTNIFSKIDDVLESSFKVKKKEYEEYLSNLEVEYKSAQEGIKEFSKDEELEDLRIRKGLITKTLQDSQEESSVVYDETKLANLDFSERIPLKEGEKTDEIISLTDEGKGRRAWRDGNENELAPSQKAANKARRIEFEKAKKDFEKSKAEADPKEPKPKKTKSKSKKDSDIHMSYGSFAPASGTVSKGTPNRSSVLQGSSADIRVSKNHGKTDEALSKITAKDREQAKNLGVVISGMVKRFKVPLIEKRYRKRPNALGWFDGKHKQITVKQKEQLSTVIHELGHKLDMDYSFNSNDDVMRMLDYVPGLKTRMNSVGYKATEMPFETMAHFIWCYLIEPDAAYEMGSYAKNENFYDYFERAVDGETLKNLQQTRRLIMAYFSKDVKERVSGQIRTREEVRKERTSPFRERWAEVQRLFIDHTYGAGQAMKGIRKLKGGQLTSEEDLQIALEFAGSSASVTDAIVRRGLVGRDGFIISDANLADILNEVETEGRKQSGKKKDAVLKDFSTYLISKHSIDRENLGQVTMSKDATDGDNIKAYESIISELDAEYSTLFEQQAEKLYSWFDAVMKEWVVDGGLLEPEIYSRMREMYPHYVPMFRVMDMTGGKAGNKKSLNPIKRVSKDGSARQIYDPIENLMLQVNNIVASCKRNQLGRVIDNLWNDEDENVRAEIASFVASIEPNLKVNKVHTAGLKQKLQNELFMREYNSWEPERKAEFDKLSDKDKILQMAEYGESDIINTVISDILLEFQATGNGMGDDVIAFRQGNSTKYYQILDPVLANALKGAEPTPGYVRMIGKVTRAFTSVTTSRNPFFAVSNMVRDFQHGYVMIDAEKWYQNFTYPAEYIKALVEALAGEFAPNRASNMYVEYAATRGFDAKYMYGSDTLGNVMREIRGARNPIVAGISLIDKLNGAIESAPRYLAYKRKLYATGDVTAAGKAAREATVNFLRPGAVTKSFNQIFPFLNAAIAGIAQANKLIFSPETYTTKKGLEKLARALVGQTIPALVLTLLAAGQLDGDDEKKKEFDELGEYMKNGYWVFRIGDTWLRLPKDREVSAVFATLPMQIAMSFVYPDRDRAVTSELLKYIAENFIPQISPLGWAIVQTKNNKTWYGGQITSYADEKLLGSPKTYTEVKDNTTSRIAIWASEIVAKGPEEVRKWLGVLATPKGIDYALDQLTGVIGDIILPATTPAEGLQGVPASLKAKYTMNTAKSSRYTTEAYDIKAELDALEAAELATPEQIAWRDAFYRTLSKNSSDNEEVEYITAGDYYALIRQYRDDSSLSAEEKAEKMNDAYRHIADMTRELVYAYKNGETPEYSYGELQFPQSAADAGFTEEQYADALSRIRKANDKEYTKYQIVSGSYTAEQKEYLSDRFAGMSYENYGPKYEEMISAGITADDVNTAVELGKNYSSDKAKMLAVVSSGMPNSSVLALAVSGSVKYNDTMRRVYISAASLGVTPEEIDSIGNRADEISKELGKKSRTKEGTRKAIAEAGLSGAKATSVMTIFYPPR